MAEMQERTESREELIRQLFSEALDRVLRNEDSDPCTAIVAALLRKEKVGDEELQIVLEAHRGGPWTVDTDEKFSIFSKWCDASGAPLRVSPNIEVVNEQTVYRNDLGDCCLAEAAKGKRWAVWTRKGRLHIGFRDESDAKQLREYRVFSMEATGNKRIGLVVIEGGDTPEMIMDATFALCFVYSQ